MPKDSPKPGNGCNFATTHWTVVLAAGRGGSKESEEALASLCGAYWYPLYAFVRRLGRRPEEAQDLTQEFFARLLEKDYLRAADPERGRFRSFLLAAFKHFLSNERERAQARKRGGGQKALVFGLRDRGKAVQPGTVPRTDRREALRAAVGTAVLDMCWPGCGTSSGRRARPTCSSGSRAT